MSKFRIVRKFKLDFLGEEWKECYLEFEAFTYKELADLAKLNIDTEDATRTAEAAGKLMEVLEGKFVGGKGIDAEGKQVDIRKKDLVDLPLEVISKAVSFLMGTGPNA